MNSAFFNSLFYLPQIKAISLAGKHLENNHGRYFSIHHRYWHHYRNCS